jgi:hypothetical protein
MNADQMVKEAKEAQTRRAGRFCLISSGRQLDDRHTEQYPYLRGSQASPVGLGAQRINHVVDQFLDGVIDPGYSFCFSSQYWVRQSVNL